MLRLLPLLFLVTVVAGSEAAFDQAITGCAAEMKNLRAEITQALSKHPGAPLDLPLAAEPTAGQALSVRYAAAVLLEGEACARYEHLLRREALAAGSLPDELPDYPAPIRLALGQASPDPDNQAGGKGKEKDKRKGKDKKEDKKDKKSASPKELSPAEQLQADLKAAAGFGLDRAPDAAERLADLQEVYRHLQYLRAAIAARYRTGGATAQVQMLHEVSDPLFGPWWELKDLPSRPGAANVLPAAPDPQGMQRWALVGGWQVYGPVAVGAPALRSGALPLRTYLPRAVYPRQVLEGSGKKKVASDAQWRAWPSTTGTGFVRPPAWEGEEVSMYGRLPIGPGSDCSWYAATEITCERDGEWLLAAGIDADGQLWVNDAMVAAWPDLTPRRDLESPLLARVQLRQGSNRVLMRVRHLESIKSDATTSGCWLRVCLAGAPGQGPALQSAAAPEPAIAPQVRGWRGNWLGNEPAARPVSAWNIEDDTNVRWRSGLPWTISTPVVSGSHLITTAEPYYIVCLDKLSGELRWRQRLDVLELIAPELASEQGRAMDEYFDLMRQLNRRAGQPDEVGVSLQGRELSRDEAAARCKELNKEFYQAIKEPLAAAGLVSKYLWMNYMGPVCATPVVDGRSVYAWSSMGAVACFDLASGERRWLARLPHQDSAYGAYSSPLLIDGMLILEVVPDDSIRRGGERKGGERRDVFLLALDAATGAERWRAPVHEPISSASPVAMRLSNQKATMAVLITGGSGTTDLTEAGELRGCFLGGTVVRAEDGAVLIENMGVNCGYGTPVVVGDVVYHCGKGMMSATRLVMQSRDRIGAVRLWTQPATYGFEPSVSPHAGHLYADLAGGPGGQGDAGYAIFRMDSGVAVERQVNIGWPISIVRSDWGGSGRKYLHTAIAGDKLFLGDSGEAFGGKKLPYATVGVLQAQPQGRILARNALPARSNSSLIFDEDRIYYRNTFGVICLGSTGPAGEAYEAMQNARFLLPDLASKPPPEAVSTTAVPALTDLPRACQAQSFWQRPEAPCFASGAEPAGLLASLAADALASPLGPRIDPAAARLELTGGGSPRVFEIYAGGKRDWIQMPVRDQGRVRGRCLAPSGFKKLELSDAAPSQYYLHFLYAPEDRYVRFLNDCTHPGLRVQLGSVELQHQHRYRIAAGYHLLVSELQITGDAERDAELCLDCRFVPATDSAAGDTAAWRADITALRPYLQRVVDLCPGTDEAKQAAALLAQLR